MSDKRPSRRLGLISLGCAKNLVDSEVMLGHLAGAGWEFVSDPAQADVIVVNTCSFIGPAREESVTTILEAARYKRTGPLRRLVVAGCLVQRYRDELRRELPEVDAFIGLDELHRVTEAADPVRPAAETQGHARLRVLGRTRAEPMARGGPRWHASRYLYDHTAPRRLATPPWTAYVKIAEGCDHTCAFCAIPTFRGAFRSRQPESVVREVEELVASGVREVSLIAQDSSDYGRDLGLRDGLAQLLKALDRVDGLRWLRVHYLYPNSVTPGLIQSMADARAVLDYVDIPLQHAHRAVLARMRRGGSAAAHLALLARFRDAMPEVALRSTLIVGFPGETAEEYETLCDFVRQARFEHLGVFAYSHEEGTPAQHLQDDVPEPVKAERLERLMDLQREIVLARHGERIGRRIEVLVEGTHPETEHLLVGRARWQAPDVDGQVLINDGHARPGEFVTVELTDVAGYDLVGAVVGPA